MEIQMADVIIEQMFVVIQVIFVMRLGGDRHSGVKAPPRDDTRLEDRHSGETPALRAGRAGAKVSALYSLIRRQNKGKVL